MRLPDTDLRLRQPTYVRLVAVLVLGVRLEVDGLLKGGAIAGVDVEEKLSPLRFVASPPRQAMASLRYRPDESRWKFR